MREFVFDLVYEDIPAPVSRGLQAESALDSRAIGGPLASDEFWRIERFSGSPGAIAAIDAESLETVVHAEAITTEQCLGEFSIEILQRDTNWCEVYYHMEQIGNSENVRTLATEYLGTNILFERQRQGDTETWTVVMEEDKHIGLLYDAIQVTLRPEIRFDFGHIGAASDRRFELFANETLPQEQRQALVAAVESGYYETPRQTTLDELADKLDCPRSTLSYRLRRAEATLAQAFAAETTELASFSPTEEEL